MIIIYTCTLQNRKYTFTILINFQDPIVWVCILNNYNTFCVQAVTAFFRPVFGSRQSYSIHFLDLVMRYVQSLWDFHFCACSWYLYLWSRPLHCFKLPLTRRRRGIVHHTTLFKCILVPDQKRHWYQSLHRSLIYIKIVFYALVTF